MDDQVSQREQDGEELLAACRQVHFCDNSAEHCTIGTQHSDEWPLAVVLGARPSLLTQVVLLVPHAQVAAVRLEARSIQLHSSTAVASEAVLTWQSHPVIRRTGDAARDPQSGIGWQFA